MSEKLFCCLKKIAKNNEIDTTVCSFGISYCLWIICFTTLIRFQIFCSCTFHCGMWSKRRSRKNSQLPWNVQSMKWWNWMVKSWTNYLNKDEAHIGTWCEIKIFFFSKYNTKLKAFLILRNILFNRFLNNQIFLINCSNSSQTFIIPFIEIPYEGRFS